MNKGKIWELDKESFQELVYNSNSLADILRKLGLYVSSGNYRPLKIRLQDDNINYSHITLGLRANKGKIFASKRRSLEDVAVKNSTYSGTNLKHKLLSENILENKCIKCGLMPIWQNETLILQLDHINGDSRDNRLENLRILCPNCHSQTKTYCAKNAKYHKIKQNYYCQCGKKILKKSKRCRKCLGKIRTKNTKIIWPNQEELLKMVKETNYTQVAKQLGVSDNAIRKHLSKNDNS